MGDAGGRGCCARTSAGGGAMWGRDRDALTGGVSSSCVGCGRLTQVLTRLLSDHGPSRVDACACAQDRVAYGSVRRSRASGVQLFAPNSTLCALMRESFVCRRLRLAPCALRVLLRFNTKVSWFIQPQSVPRCGDSSIKRTRHALHQFGPSERFPSFPFLFRCRRRGPIARNRDCARALHLAGVISATCTCLLPSFSLRRSSGFLILP